MILKYSIYCMDKIMDNQIYSVQANPVVYEAARVASTLKSRHDIDADNYESGFMYIVYEYSDFLKLVVSSFKSFLHHNLYEKLNIRNNATHIADDLYAISEDKGDELSKIVGGLGAYTRISKQKSNFKVSLCVQKDRQVLDTGMASSVTNTRMYSLSQEERTKFNEIAYKEVVNIFGANIFDIDTGIDIEIPADSILINRPTLDLVKTVVNEKSIKIVKKYVKSFRLISAPSELAYPHKEYVDGNEVIITKLKDATDKAGYITKVLENRRYSLYVNLTLTPEETSYITQTDFENTNPSYVATWFVSWCTGDLAGGFASPEAINPISTIAEENSLVDTTTLRPRTNSDELSISTDGHCYFIPTIDNAKQYDAELQQLGARNDGEFCYEDDKEIKKSRVALQDMAKKPRLPTNRIIYTDWINNKLAYSDTNGALKIMDLEGYMPCTNNVYSRVLGMPLMQGNKDNTIRLNHLSFAVRYAVEKGIVPEIKDEDKDFFFQNEPFLETDLLSYLKSGAIEEYVGMVFSRLNRKALAAGRPDYIEEYAHKDAFVYALIDENSPIPVMRPLGRLIKAAYELSIKDIPSTLEYRSVINGLGQLALLTILVKYMGKKSIIDATDAEERKVYTNPDFDPEYKPENIALVKDISLQPHQVKVFTYLKNIPKNAIIESDAGGGKTIQVLLDILFNMNKGVKKPLIMCPSHLVKDYIKEANFVAKGRLNVVPITTSTFKTYGEDKLKQLIEHSPINTVFITDYNFIKGNAEDVVYGTTIITVGHNAEFLRQFDWDYVALDESHLLKNISQRQASVQRLVSEIPIKRLATGTFISDTILDTVKQFALIDPSVFGSQQKFVELYANETRGGKVLSWKSGTEALVASKMKQFATVIKTKRKEWAALLPDRIEEFHFVELTQAQRAVYDAILQETIEIIKADKELMEKLNSQDETLADELEAMLRPYLARLEQFLSSPASDPAGEKALLDPEDMISPKAKMVHKLCRDHLVDKSDTGKVLIFTSYKESAKSIYESMPQDLKDMTVFYTAETKFQAGEEFENNPNKRIMVGVENSMNTGLNLQFCFPEQTPVLIDHNSSLTIKEIFENDNITHVLSYDLKNKRIEKRKILRKIRTKVKDTDNYVTVVVKDNKTGVKSSIVCTDNHPFILKGGKEVNAGDLEVGSQLITYGNKFERLKIEESTGELLPYNAVPRIACSHCDDVFHPHAIHKHLADDHGVSIKEYNSRKSVRSAASALNWENSEYRDSITVKIKEFYNSDEGKQVLSKISKLRWSNSKAREKASLQARKRWSDPSYSERVGQAISDSLNTPKTRKLLSKNSKKMWESEEFRAKHAESIEAYWSIPKNRKLRSKISKEIWRRPEVLEKAKKSHAIVNSTEERKKSRSENTANLHRTIPGHTARTVGAMLKAQGTLPNIPETAIIDLNIEGLKYTGNGEYFVSLEMNGKRVIKNPDFISMNHVSKKGRVSRVVEVIGAREFTGRDKKYDRALIKAYADKGIECSIIEATDCYYDDTLNNVHTRLQSFINNHYLTVVKVQRNTNSNTVGKYKYDLEVAKNHNFFACTTRNQGGRSGYIPITPILVHNCSRLIRIETVWNPGTLEQGESRINRPELKKKETRKNIHFDWIVTNRSIDVTKIGRLIGKIISKTKFDEYQNQLYAGLPDIELITMSLDSITQHNDFRSTLSDHLEAFQTLKQIEQSEFDAYRNDPKVKKDMVDIPDGNIPNGSKLLKHVPYVAGMSLYGQADLGLVGYNEFLRNELDEDFDPIGLQIHTEFGDGECIGVRKNTLRIRLSDGSSVSVDKLAAFVITRKSTSTKDIRQQLMKLAGLAPATTDDLKKVRPEDIVDEKPTVPTKTKVLKPVPNKDDKLNHKFNLYFTIINNSIALGVDTEDPDVHQRQLSKYGFKPTSPYIYTHVKTARTMRLLIDQITSKFEVGSQYVNRLEALYEAFNLGKSKLLNVNQASQIDLKNFLRLKFKASGSKELKPYPLIQDGELYILIDTTMQPAAKRVPSKVIGPGIKWFNEGGDLYAFFDSKGDVKSTIVQMKKDGLEIENLEDLKAEFSEIKLFKRKS